MTLRLNCTRRNGRLKLKSPDVPGLFLASDDIGALFRDLDDVTATITVERRTMKFEARDLPEDLGRDIT